MYIAIPALGLPSNEYGTKYSRMGQVKFFKGCLSQILLGPFLNTLRARSLVVSDLRSETKGSQF